MKSESNLIWVDMEMTGLIPEQHRVIEIATIITDSELNELAVGPVIAVNQSDAELGAMDDWNTTHHTQSGLVERVRKSEYNEQRAVDETLAFWPSGCPRARPLCVVIPFVRTGALWRATCQSLRPIFTTATSMSALSRFWRIDGALICQGLQKKQRI